MPRIISKQMDDLRKFINSFTQDNGYCPSYREMMSVTGFKSPASVKRLLDKMEKMSLIKRLPNRDRSITVLDPLPAGEIRIIDELPRGGVYRITEKGHAFLENIKPKGETA